MIDNNDDDEMNKKKERVCLRGYLFWIGISPLPPLIPLISDINNDVLKIIVSDFVYTLSI